MRYLVLITATILFLFNLASAQTQSPPFSVTGANGHFTFSVTKASNEPGMDSFNVDISCRGKVISSGESMMAAPDIESMDDTPTIGCEAIMAGLYSGGANCCYNHLLAISCEFVDYLFDISGGHVGTSLEDADGDGTKELVLSDQRFWYYNPDDRHFISGADSIGLIRYAVWTPNGWKVTAPGELSKRYSQLMNEAIHGKEYNSETSRAIAVAYYALMSGEDGAKVKKQLQGQLPGDWKPITNKVFGDITASVSHKPTDPDSNGDVITMILPVRSAANEVMAKKDTAAPNAGPNVELFVTSWCPHCKKAKQFFQSRGIAYIGHDVEKDRNAAIRRSQMDSRTGVPFAMINGQKVLGFSEEAYANALSTQASVDSLLTNSGSPGANKEQRTPPGGSGNVPIARSEDLNLKGYRLKY